MSKPSLPVLHTEGMIRKMTLHPGLPLIVSSPRIPLEVPDAARTAVRQPRRLSAYLFFWVIEGSSVYNVDMEMVRLESGQLLFVQPNQIHQSVSDWKQARDWYKIAFEGDCLSLLPHTYDFLLNRGD